MELGILDLLIQFIIILFAIVVSSLVTIPFVGVIVRFRANYNPKGLRLDAEGDATPHTGPIVRSLTAMFLRVRDLEVRCPKWYTLLCYLRVLSMFRDGPDCTRDSVSVDNM